MTKKAAKFEKPEAGYADVEDLQGLKDLALDEYSELRKVPRDEISDEQLERMELLKAEIGEIKAEEAARAEAEAERQARIDAALDDADLEDDDEEDEDAGDDDESDDDADEDESEDDDADEDEKAEKVAEPILASGRKRPSPTGTARRKALAKRKVADEAEDTDVRKATIFAGAEIAKFSSGQELNGMDQLVEAYMGRLKSMPGGGTKRVGRSVSTFNVGRIEKTPEPRYKDFAIDESTSAQDGWNRIQQASRLSNVATSAEGLVAAGGWCVPSTNYLDLLQYETTTGGLDLPEISVVGGINFTRGPEFEDIFDDTGFLQTEADAIAGDVKSFLEVACPDWEEIRLDAIGYGVKAPILTASPAGFPALIRRYLEGASVAHWHKVNAYVINAVLAGLGSVQNFVELGSATADLLNAVEIAVWSLRYKFRMAESQTFEAMFPMWVKGALRADLSRRTGVDMLAVTDAQVNAWFTLRGIRPQFVFDWAGQDLSGTALQYPQQVRFGIWPAGSFVKGTNNVITLDAIYDSTEIETNTYTAAFFEEAILVARTGGQGRLFSVGLDLYGRTGAASLGSTYDGDNS